MTLPLLTSPSRPRWLAELPDEVTLRVAGVEEHREGDSLVGATMILLVPGRRGERRRRLYIHNPEV